ncbi:hypothetical protein ABDK00_012710 [Niabella insulamsoli]|uniref:COG1470 family protein n=1 Tax=Niabella insulamsoli TaxID=3144874 RepID=UPI0031FCD34C
MPFNKNKTGESDSRKKAKDDLFEKLDPNNMMSNAQRVLSSAVNVLEEEIAAGILAAKKIEGEIIDVEDLREDPQDLMNRIRRDIHEAVDLIMDSVTAMARHFGSLSDTVLNKKSEEKPAPQQDSPQAIPVITASKPVKAGDTAVLYVTLSNDRQADPVIIAFRKAALCGKGKSVIAANAINMMPSPVRLSSGEEAEMTVQVKVPKTAVPGVYSGLFVDANDSGNRLIIHLDVN